MNKSDKQEIIKSIKEKLISVYGKTLEDATPKQKYSAVARTLRDAIMSNWIRTNMEMKRQMTKKLYYLSIEFLIGRSLCNNLINMGVDKELKAALKEIDVDLNELIAQEKDPGLGNGGLGRLAACFMDSLASLNLPAMGCGIRYEYGLFSQKIENGVQTEYPDAWLKEGKNIWEVERKEEMLPVRFGGHIHEEWVDGRMYVHHDGFKTVMALPYDMPVVGYGGETINTLRLWSASSPVVLNMEYFSQGEYARATEEKELSEVISKMLYPADGHYAGKKLRLSQHYFFSSATMQYIVNEHKAMYGDLRTLPDKVVVQINDTHPSLAMPELMRILMDEEGFGWEEAEDITRRVFCYTNHTVMSEALEAWPVSLMRELLPRIYSIIVTLNNRYSDYLKGQYPGQMEKVNGMAIIEKDNIKMAALCIVLSHSVNGVSQLHGEILKRGIFKEYYVQQPEKFSGITNGITHRRWLMESNPRLSGLITECIGNRWIRHPKCLQELDKFKQDPAFIQQFESIKTQNKQRLASFLQQRQGSVIDPASIFDVQIKRLHEYKRQFLNILHVMHLYNKLKDNPKMDFHPQTFLFGAKAWPGYTRAKRIIQLINTVAAMIDKDPVVSKKLKVVFMENYNVSKAQIIIPASDVSEQISTAGKEASGTGNMKLMMNGAVTIGTMDGANVEIFEQVGPDNIFIFGHTADEVEHMLATCTYASGEIYVANNDIKRVLDQLIDGSLGTRFEDLFNSLLFGDGKTPDEYIVMGDFDSYAKKQAELNLTYRNKDKWWSMAIENTLKSGVFSSDRTITEYNDNLWHLKQLKPMESELSAGYFPARCRY